MHVFQGKGNNLLSGLSQTCLMVLSWGDKTVTYYAVHSWFTAYLVLLLFINLFTYVYFSHSLGVEIVFLLCS